MAAIGVGRHFPTADAGKYAPVAAGAELVNVSEESGVARCTLFSFR